MTHQDYIDTFIYATLDEMISSSESELTNGTFTIAESASVTNYTEVSGSGTVIFSDTRADTSAYSAAGIPETLDQPTTITNSTAYLIISRHVPGLLKSRAVRRLS